MRAAELRQPGPIATSPLRFVERTDPQPGPGEVRLAVRACGVCHTDLHIVTGELPPHRTPVIPGHQVVGIVEALGPDTTGVAVGDRVGLGWLFRSCGGCRACRRGEENLCEGAMFTGWDADGGFADRLVADARFVVPIPPSFSDVDAAPLLCAGVIGYRTLRVAGVRPGERVGIYGFGASAHLILPILVRWGCEVAVFTRGAHHRELASHLGAEWVGGPEDPAPRPLDHALLFAPAGRLVPLALRGLRPGGTLTINAVYMDGIPAFDYGLLHGERVVRTVAHVTRDDAQVFLPLAARLNLTPTVERFPLEAVHTALARLEARSLRAAAVLDLTLPPAK